MGSKKDAQIHCSELATGQALLWTYTTFETAEVSLIPSEELLLVEYSFFVCRHQSFLSTEEFAQLTLQENEPRFNKLASRFPSCDYEHSNVHAHVATAEFLMNFWTHWICLSQTDGDHVILQPGTKTIHVSNVSSFSTRNMLDLDIWFNF